MREIDALDRYDRQILAALQIDGRLTNQELAERINLSASQCSRRRMRLERTGLILDCPARLDREKLGFELTVFVAVTLNTHNRDNARRFADLMHRLPNVLEAHALTGEMDYQVKIAVGNLRQLSELINEVLMPHAAVQTVKTSIVLDTIKESTRLPIE